jgi:GTP pyrophosphokinase
VAESLANKRGELVVTPTLGEDSREFTARISLRGIDRVGLLNEISRYISFTMGMNMVSLTLGSKDGVFEGSIELQVRSRKTLQDMLDGLQKIDGIQDVVRTEI